MTEKWEISGTVQHTKSCHGQFGIINNYLYPNTFSELNNLREMNP